MIKRAKLRVYKAHKNLQDDPLDPTTRLNLQEAQKTYRRLVRKSRLDIAQKRDKMVHNILENNPKSLFTFLRNCKSSSNTAPTQKLTVGNKTYEGNNVPMDSTNQ